MPHVEMIIIKPELLSDPEDDPGDCKNEMSTVGDEEEPDNMPDCIRASYADDDDDQKTIPLKPEMHSDNDSIDDNDHDNSTGGAHNTDDHSSEEEASSDGSLDNTPVSKSFPLFLHTLHSN